MSVQCQYNVSMTTQKLYKNGNSVAVTIPKEYLRELNLRDGSLVAVERKGDELIVMPQKKAVAASVDEKFARMVDEFIHDHEDVLRKLAKK